MQNEYQDPFLGRKFISNLKLSVVVWRRKEYVTEPTKNSQNQGKKKTNLITFGLKFRTMIQPRMWLGYTTYIPWSEWSA